jgi:hypothetical protein
MLLALDDPEDVQVSVVPPARVSVQRDPHRSLRRGTRVVDTRYTSRGGR